VSYTKTQSRPLTVILVSVFKSKKTASGLSIIIMIIG